MKRQVYNVYHWSEDIPIVTTTDLDIKKELDIICLEFDGHPWEWDKFSEPGRSHESLFHVRAAVVANFVGHGFYTYKETFMMVPENMEDKELIERFNGVYSNKPQFYQENGAQGDIERYDKIVKRELREEVPVSA